MNMSETLIVPGNQEMIADLEIDDTWFVPTDGKPRFGEYVDRLIRNVVNENGKKRFAKVWYGNSGILVIRKM